MDEIILVSSDSSTQTTPRKQDTDEKLEDEFSDHQIFKQISQDSGHGSAGSLQQRLELVSSSSDEFILSKQDYCSTMGYHKVSSPEIPEIPMSPDKMYYDEALPDEFEPAVNLKRPMLEMSPNLATKITQKKTKTKNTTSLEEKMRKKEERERKKEQMAHDKAVKQAIAANRRVNKPGECLKTITAQIDLNLIQESFGGAILSALETLGVEHNMQEQPLPFAITWTRQMLEFTAVGGTTELTTKVKEEDQALLIWNWKKVAREIQQRMLGFTMRWINSILSGKKITLIIYGSKDQLSGQKHPKKKQPKNVATADLPVISQWEFEMALIALQDIQCQHRLVDSPEELGTLVAQFTKAVAEKPFKLEKQLKEQNGQVEWYATADSRDCVKVDKNGNGLLRLWKQQLCQFNLAGLSTAEAISAVYPSPKVLTEAYRKCSTQEEAQLLLQDIPIRRGAGPLASVKRVGPELSRKIHTLFTATDGETQL